MSGRTWRTWRWLYLACLGFGVYQVVLGDHGSAGSWALFGCIVLGAAIILALGIWRPQRSRWSCTVPMAVLAVAATPFNVGAGALFVFAAANAGLTESRRTALRWFAALTVVTCVLSLFSQVPMPWRLWGVIPPVVLIWIIGLTQLEKVDRRRDAAEQRVRGVHAEHLATMAERERIARDLHDLLGHSLTAVVMRAQLIGDLATTDPERVTVEATEIEQTARGALSEVRGTVSGWRQGNLDTELDSATRSLASIGVRLTVRRADDLHLLGSTEHELALALREAMTNVARHAHATRCTVAIDAYDGELRLVVADDGVGGAAPEGNGLTGLRERITALGGQVQRSGSAGTTMTIAVPLRVAT